MTGEELVALLYSDLSGLARGRAVPARDLAERLEVGVGWVPADQALTPLGPIAEPNPWGPIGDLRLLPDPSTEVRVDLWPEVSPMHFLLCDATEMDGSGWAACPRVLLKRALDDLRSEMGLRLVASFEHEFQLLGLPGLPGPGFSMEALRRAEPFGPMVMAALQEAGQQPETFLPEYGPWQYEVTCRPAEGVAAADRATIVRELVREVARRMGLRASFAPIIDPDSVGNGVHVHLSFIDVDGESMTYDESRAGRVSDVAGHFAAGIIRHLPALIALTAPSVVSSLRLTPHRWSAGYVVFGERNREAALRIAPGIEIPGHSPATQLNLEYRAADAAASPYLALAAVVLAGLQGLRESLPDPPLVNVDPATLSDTERRTLGASRLPTSLPAALQALEADQVVRSWFPGDLWDCYLSMKRTEIDLLDGLDPREQCSRYANVY